MESKSDSEYPLGRFIAVQGKGGKTTLSKDSVVYDLWRRRELFRNVARRARENAPENCRVIVIESAQELDEFYRDYGLERA